MSCPSCNEPLRTALALPYCAVYAKTAEQAMKLQGLQKGQRVAFDVKCVCDIRYHDSDESDDEY